MSDETDFQALFSYLDERVRARWPPDWVFSSRGTYDSDGLLPVEFPGLKLYVGTLPFEAEYIYREIFQNRIYTPDNVSLSSGDTVVDVGANAGMFTLFLAANYRNLRIHAVEPVPRTLLALRRNVASLANGCTCRIHPVALGDGTIAEATISSFPNFAGNSTFHPETKDRQRDRMRAGGLFDDNVLEFIYRVDEVTVPVITLSRLLHEESIQVVDLLKIDTEASEVEVLRGIEPRDWTRIRQVVLELHEFTDTDLKPACVELLESNGMTLVGDDDAPDGMPNRTLVALRQA